MLCFIVLSVFIWIWVDLFVFSKVQHLPAWQAILPPLLRGTFLLALVPLLPAMFLTKRLKDFLQVTLGVILLAPWPALIKFFIDDLAANTAGAVQNVLGNFVWIAFQCLIPLSLLFALFVILLKWVRKVK